MSGAAAAGGSRGPLQARVSLREARIAVGRLLVTLGIPLGSVPAVTEFVIQAELTGSAALQYIRAEFAALREDARQPGLCHRSGAPGRVVADGAGRAALLLGPDVADLAVAAACQHGVGTVHVTDLRDPAFLEALDTADALPGFRLSARATCRDSHVTGSCLVTCVAVAATGNQAGDGPALALPACVRSAIADGMQVGSGLWRWLCDKSADALTPDSPLSQRHTGRL